VKDFSWYRGGLLWLPDRTVFLTKHGSHAYGTNLPTSDMDLKGIVIAPREYYLGFTKTFEQAEVRDPFDVVIYDIRKFFKLASDCNPNIIEVLFTDQADWVLPEGGSTAVGPSALCMVWWQIWAQRDLFLSKRAQYTFSGYAVAQLKRIKTHRAWLLNPPSKKPERSDFGLRNTEGTLGREQLGVIEARIRKTEDTMGGRGLTKDLLEEDGVQHSLVTTAISELNLDVNLIPIVLAERKYASACRYWDAYHNWKSERNATRAELEANFGYDTKHAMHLVRLLRMAKEILRDRQVLVKRPDAAELLEIRAGAWSYDRLVDYAQTMERDLAAVAAESSLPREPPRRKLDDLLVRLLHDVLMTS
jgi:predicted nucleotidyltransferase